jgi:excisionase family DNA binding protein
MNATSTLAAEPERLLKVREVAERLRLSPPTVYRRIARGDLRALRAGRSRCAPIRVEASEVERFLRSAPR